MLHALLRLRGGLELDAFIILIGFSFLPLFGLYLMIAAIGSVNFSLNT